MNRPSVDASLKPLKPFQRRTVDHAFDRLFNAPGGSGRFLVADEVGLGKTLVARGIIARTIDHLWDDVSRIDIVYICSNGSIARANLPKLRVGGADERSFASATRLTMLATELAPRDGQPSLADSKLNFVSFTPGTSFNMGWSGGQRREREVLYHLLEPLIARRLRTALMNFLQGWVQNKDDWRRRLTRSPRMPIEDAIRGRFEAALRKQPDLEDSLRGLLDEEFHRYRQSWPDGVWQRRDHVTADLRRILAGACVEALEPDLIILDEFQRFKELLDSDNPVAELAQELFGATTPEGMEARTLLLSATPYKPYTTDAEIDQEDHYADFLETTRFLLRDDTDGPGIRNVRSQLSDFRKALKAAAAGEPGQEALVVRAKGAVERTLRDVMSRTERVAATEQRDAMVSKKPCTTSVEADDIGQYLASDALFRAVGDRDPMAFWKSAPYLAHFMHGYRFNDRLDDAMEAPDRLVEALRRHDPGFLRAEALRTWKALAPAHPKLRGLVDELHDGGLWRLLWIPPTLKYWPLEGPFEGTEGLTKRLLFSAWNVVPDVVSAVLSYEAERRMSANRIATYENPARQQSQLLRIAQSAEGVRRGHRLLLLLLPCLTLADRAHPLAAPAGADRRCWVRERVKGLLSAAGLPDPQEGEVDKRWEWAAPVLLDPGLRDFLREWRDGGRPAWPDEERLPQPNPEVFGAYVDDLLAVDPETLGRRPPGLVQLLTDAALGSPAILAARTMWAGSDLGDDARRTLAVRVAVEFWSLFNQPSVIALLRQLATDGAGHDDSRYWHLVLHYCRQGNLQAVLDEHWHLLREQEFWSEDDGADVIAGRCARKLVEVLHPKPARVHAQFFTASSGASVAVADRERMRIRTVFALRFGHIRTDDGENISQDAVRAAFNSPFRPFVLASTSIGQEGLDFHPWCHRLTHWNLPGNPVDLEQREGRVHRYKGHAVRRNVAEAHGPAALNDWSLGEDIWELIFESAEKAARADQESDLVPCWIARGKHSVEQHVPLLPYTTDQEIFDRLKRQVAAYRVAFGQPRQEELITLLGRSGLDPKKLSAWAIDLSPPAPPGPEAE